MIVKKSMGCCGRSALKGFGASSFLGTWDELYVAAAGTKSLDDMYLVWSEWICGDMQRRFEYPNTLVVALAEAGLADRANRLLVAWQELANKGVTAFHKSASCAQGGGDGGYTLTGILDLGKKVVDTVKPVVDDATGNKTPTGTTGTGTTGTKAGATGTTPFNSTLLIGLGAAGVAAFLLLSPKKRK
jgi:hypothetical protein